jgi:hypothetical protein
MNDTSFEIEKKYKEIIMSKTSEERFRMGLEMTEAGRLLMIAGIKSEHPDIKEIELKKEILKRLRKYDNTLFWLDNLQLW